MNHVLHKESADWRAIATKTLLRAQDIPATDEPGLKKKTPPEFDMHLQTPQPR